MAPEMMGSHNYSKSVDTWSFGITLIELFTLESPYPAGMQPFEIAKLVSLKQLRPRKLERRALPHGDLLNTLEGCVRFRADARLPIKLIEGQLQAALNDMNAQTTLRRLAARSNGSSIWDRTRRHKQQSM